jgi:outer membrane protein
MKSFLLKMVPGLLLLVMLSSPAMGQTKIGTVNLRKIFEGYWKKKDAEAALKDRETDIQKEIKTMMSDYDKAKEDYQKLLTAANDQAVSSDEREKRKRSAEDKLKKIKESEDRIKAYDRDAAEDIKERRKRVRDKLLNDINTVLVAKAKTASYSMVLDTEAETVNGTKVILYSNNENDFTDEVLKQLNADAPSETSEKKPEPKEEKKNGKEKSSKK